MAPRPPKTRPKLPKMRPRPAQDPARRAQEPPRRPPRPSGTLPDAPNIPQITPKTPSRREIKIIFDIDFGSILVAFWLPTWPHLGAQNGPRTALELPWSCPKLPNHPRLALLHTLKCSRNVSDTFLMPRVTRCDF